VNTKVPSIKALPHYSVKKKLHNTKICANPCFIFRQLYDIELKMRADRPYPPKSAGTGAAQRETNIKHPPMSLNSASLRDFDTLRLVGSYEKQLRKVGDGTRSTQSETLPGNVVGGLTSRLFIGYSLPSVPCGTWRSFA
jgi:hypothetical protein